MGVGFYLNQVYIQDEDQVPYYGQFTNQANLFVEAPIIYGNQGSIFYSTQDISDTIYQIQTGSYFLAKSTNKTIILPDLPTLDPNSPPIASRSILITDTGLLSTHIITANNGVKINGSAQITLQAKQTVHFLFTGTQWIIVSAFPAFPSILNSV